MSSTAFQISHYLSEINIILCYFLLCVKFVMHHYTSSPRLDSSFSFNLFGYQGFGNIARIECSKVLVKAVKHIRLVFAVVY